jgi:aspartyl-tRNA(Asn)/glutamyl-tRNA(Gln) amidotransferase subunit A
MSHYHFSTISTLQQDLRAGVITCVELVQQCIARIADKKQLNAYLEVFELSALAQAKNIDLKIKAGSAGQLAGVLVGLKDNICYKGHKVSASSKILEGFESLYSATVVERLLAEDAIIVGRLNCDEFAMGSSNENSAFGNVLFRVRYRRLYSSTGFVYWNSWHETYIRTSIALWIDSIRFFF